MLAGYSGVLQILLLMEDNDHVLCVPRNREEWRAYNAIRRKVLFENRGEVGVYITQTVAVIARSAQQLY